MLLLPPPQYHQVPRVITVIMQARVKMMRKMMPMMSIVLMSDDV